jgi:CRISPR/Cas system CSM-associated protein Csm3 (group 7 of RAMP superfamily)
MLKVKVVLKGTIKLLSPVMIGSGKDENSDMDILRGSDGVPYIPATSFVGVIRHAIKLKDSYKDNLEKFWGFSNDKRNNLMQSSVIVSDLLSKDNTNVTVRDGVRINNKKGVAEEGAKFDYEIIERDSAFELYMEITLNEKNDDFKKQMLATIIELLKNGKIRIGAKTNSGFGKIKLDEYNIYEFNFSVKEDVLRWFKQDFSKQSNFNVEAFKLDKKAFTIDAYFTIKNSLIVRSYNYEPDIPDVEHIKSDGRPVLPGTSIKGAIRSRAEKIINTLGKPESLIEKLFGDVDEVKKEACKGRILVEESLINSYPEEVQTRIKIDRFTGGVMEGALLETKPQFRGKDEKIFNIKITINDYEDHQAGLMLLVLKDLWTGDLPIGGEKAIGRGVLQGKRVSISWDGNTITFDDVFKLKEEQKNQLQGFVSTMVNYGGKA